MSAGETPVRDMPVWDALHRTLVIMKLQDFPALQSLCLRMSARGAHKLLGAVFVFSYVSIAHAIEPNAQQSAPFNNSSSSVNAVPANIFAKPIERKFSPETLYALLVAEIA